MANGQAVAVDESIHDGLVAVTINNVELDQTPISDLMLAKEGVTELAQELDNEIRTHLSDEPDAQKVERGSKEIKEGQIVEIMFKVNRDQLWAERELLEHVAALVSPRFDRVLGRLADKPVLFLIDHDWTRPVAAILPTVLFALLEVLIINIFGQINGWVLLGTIGAALLSIFFAVSILRFFSEVRKYVTQEGLKNIQSEAVRSR